MNIKTSVLAAIFMVAANISLNAQRIAVTSNLLEDALLTPNVGVDIVVADRQSVTFDTSFAPYKVSGRFHNKCMTFRAGYRYWFNQALYAHCIGVDAVVSSSDVRAGRWQSRDEYAGIGIGYGYSFIIGKRLNLIPCVGIGVAYGGSYEGYDRMTEAGECEYASARPGFMPILTRLGVTIQYVLR